MDASQIIQFSFSGLTLGSIYALMAVSLGIVYKASKVISFAQGEFFVIGALTMVTLTSVGLFLPLAFALSVLVAACSGAIMERVLIRPVSQASIGVKITMTIAISLTLRGLALLIWGRSSHISEPFSAGEPLRLMGAALQVQVLWIMGMTALALVLIWYFFEKTLLGTAMRACAENPLGSVLMGINVNRVTMFSWMWGSALGAVAGLVVAPLYFLQYASGTMPMIKGFIAMAIGGLSSTLGAVLAGFFLGLLEAYSIGFLSSQYSDVIVFGVLILVLLGRSRGFWGTPDDGGM
ncbi:MAG: branched-chain amino acid ABC transporter permease [Deltaproteobacteria bacterium]|nr:branched-chain amino acid ABC transporter permease [Deltaproteobacteria bacterium]